MKKDKIIKILVPVLIIAIIAGIWFIKNPIETSKGTETPTENSETISEASDKEEVKLDEEDASSELTGADFGLRETKAIDFEALSAYGLPIIVDYGADSCIPCQAMAPILESANETFAGKAFIKFINVWDYPDAANNVPVQVIPTQIIFDADGKPFIPSDELAAEIQFDMYYSRDTGEHIFTVHQGGLTEEQMWAILEEMGVTE